MHQMTYATEHIVSALKTARETKRLSQRELSAKSGVPQGHISKIETAVVDLRLSSLVELARVLDLELTLVPRKSVSAVQSIVRSGTPQNTVVHEAEAAHSAQRELAKILKTTKSLPEIASITKEMAQFQRQLQELQRLQIAKPEAKALREINKAVKAFRNNTNNIGTIRQIIFQFQSIRNAIAHNTINLPQIEQVRPAYSLDGDDDG